MKQAMPRNRESIIAEGVRSLQENTRSGVLSCVTFTDGKGEHWLKYDSQNSLCFDWPFARKPDSAFELNYLTPLISWKQTAWSADTSAAYTVTNRHPDTLARVIDSIFCRLYELPKDHVISWTTQSNDQPPALTS